MVVEIKNKYIDVEYKDMIVRINYNKFDYIFEIIEGEGSLSPDDKLNLIRMMNYGKVS